MPLSKAAMRELKRDMRGSVKPNQDPDDYKYNRAAILSKTQRLELLSEIAKNGNIKQTNPVEAMKEINKMLGDYAPIKHQVAGKVRFVVSYKPSLEALQSTTRGIEGQTSSKLLDVVDGEVIEDGTE